MLKSSVSACDSILHTENEPITCNQNELKALYTCKLQTAFADLFGDSFFSFF